MLLQTKKAVSLTLQPADTDVEINILQSGRDSVVLRNYFRHNLLPAHVFIEIATQRVSSSRLFVW